MTDNNIYSNLDLNSLEKNDVKIEEDLSEYIDETIMRDVDEEAMGATPSFDQDDVEAEVEQIDSNDDDEIIDDNSYNEPYISENFLDASNKLYEEFYSKFSKRESGDFDTIDFQEFTKRAIEVLREDFAKTTLEKARQTTIQQSKSILDVFKSHIVHDDELKKRLEKKFGKEILIELEEWDKSKGDKETEKFTHNTLGINNTSLFLEIARYLFSPYIQFPELFADDKPDKVSVAEVFNYANVIEIEKTTNDDIQKQFTRFETDDKIQKLFMNNRDLEGIYEKIKYDSYKIHTYFSVFILLWSSPFDERDYGIQQYSKTIALLSEKLVQFMDTFNSLDKLYPKDEFAKRIHNVLQTHINTFDEGLKSLDRASLNVEKRTMNFLDEIDKSLTRFQKLKRELDILENFGTTLEQIVKNIDEGIKDRPNTKKYIECHTNKDDELLKALQEINEKLVKQDAKINYLAQQINTHTNKENIVQEEVKEEIIEKEEDTEKENIKNKKSIWHIFKKLC